MLRVCFVKELIYNHSITQINFERYFINPKQGVKPCYKFKF